MVTQQQLSHYNLLKKLGAGGMGEVYLAEDLKLNRKIALKVLPADVARDRKRLTRFLQEARLAANLNHPNICTIYEVSGDAEKPFIAMEFVEGETLSEKIQTGQISLSETLDLAVQIADALDEAHTQGVIHRDIKSANIIINRRGHAKVLDFGLAKTTVAADEDISGEAETQAKTDAGMLVGTVPYMSPEHALGKKLDGRTDLWSFGVLLYEMACGVLPFRGATQAAVFDRILNQNPPPPSEINDKVSPELENIICKLLEKDREFRYQTASDLRADLKRLSRGTGEFSAFERLSASAPVARISAENLQFSQTAFGRPQTGRIEGAAETQNAQSPSAKSDNWSKAILILIIVGMFGLAAFAIHRLFNKDRATVAGSTFDKTDAQRLTNLGRVRDAVVSADGRYVVYVQDEGELQSLWLNQITTGSAVQIIAPAAVTYQGLAFSTDGNWIYYNIWDRRSVGEIFRIPALGGAAQKIVRDCMPAVGVSPDNRKVAFIRSVDKTQTMQLIVVDVESREEKILVERGKSDGPIGIFAWAPDGQSLAVLGVKLSPDAKNYLALDEVSLADGVEKPIWHAVPSRLTGYGGGMVWKPDKSGILLTLSESFSPYNQIWSIDYASGEARRLTKDFNSYGGLSMTADGKKIISVLRDFFASIWVAPLDKPNETQKLTGGKIEGIGLSWTPDGRIVYGSTVSGNLDLWIADADGANKKQLTGDTSADFEPCVTADGKEIFFLSDRINSEITLWRMNLDGTNQRRVIDHGYQWDTICPKRGDAVYFSGLYRNEYGFWRLPVSGSEPAKVAEKISLRVDLSGDAKRLAYSVWNPEKQQIEREIYEMASGKNEKFELPPSAVGEQGENEVAVRWAADDRGLSFINRERGVSNIWLYNFANKKTSRLTNFNENSIFTYDWSFDGKRLAVTRFSTASDVVVINDAK